MVRRIDQAILFYLEPPLTAPQAVTMPDRQGDRGHVSWLHQPGHDWSTEFGTQELLMLNSQMPFDSGELEHSIFRELFTARTLKISQFQTSGRDHIHSLNVNI